MDKQKQTELVKWLKQQSAPAKHWLRLSMLLGIISGLLIVTQAWLLATILQALIIDNVPRKQLLVQFSLLICVFIVRAIINFIRESVGFICGKIVRQQIRSMVLNKLNQLGPIWVKNKPAGSWATIILEQIEDIQDYYARYLPQMYLAAMIPIIILIAIFPLNWAAGLILFITAPLIPLFMILVGMGAADVNRRNFVALARLSGRFLDRLRGLDTLRLFFRANKEIKDIEQATEEFRKRTMEVLRMAFLSSAVLEFFTSISIAIVAVYFGFSYLGELHFGTYGIPVTLFAGFLALILAPEFFQPLRDLGTYYHAKAQAVGAAESLFTLLASIEQPSPLSQNNQLMTPAQPLTITAQQLEIFSHDNVRLAGPLNFTLLPNQRIALVGQSGAGKSSLLNALLGFLPYRGSLTVNGIELRDLDMADWRKQLSWVGQNPHLPAQTIIDNIRLYSAEAAAAAVNIAMENAYVTEFIKHLPTGVDTQIGENGARLSVGQAQRIAVARALLNPCLLLLLDEPAASLDMQSEQRVMTALNAASTKQTTLLVTHLLAEAAAYDQIWVMENGLIIEQGTYSKLSQTKGAFSRLLTYHAEEI
ncbi:cysteine/glutathione ABC transporter permease/ATP-binding protein CydD [Arsenophonus endosymbiont of Aphis craccivora]|uniref:heme ABC transporter permease/ATP-binding protein CydD n=1 Tax=Arsenophonus endosymbiont of Aphis craccivora TaxID=1231049 RepID=UPI0015DBF6AD|nr:cysteine/glutathione ABC transporter permease/ATP-binding protein CydD [Arsenophonus endosymbiont of Aphis craccivora]QLK87949.1 cysteine/glutathione ABC transporter permease/ATP-binding protein CydD [Arsenophonus endosymbiont of Aphis craccivora]